MQAPGPLLLPAKTERNNYVLWGESCSQSARAIDDHVTVAEDAMNSLGEVKSPAKVDDNFQ